MKDLLDTSAMAVGSVVGVEASQSGIVGDTLTVVATDPNVNSLLVGLLSALIIKAILKVSSFFKKKPKEEFPQDYDLYE